MRGEAPETAYGYANRRNALKGATPGTDPARNKAGRCLADESVEGSRKPEDASGHVR